MTTVCILNILTVLTDSNVTFHFCYQVVPNVKSRDQIGKAGTKNLLEYFITLFGAVDSSGFRKAQRAFVESMAGYAIICYLLHIKVRQHRFED